MQIIAILNQKGGVGKTTTAGVTLAGLTLKGFNTLAIDLDAQTNLSLIAGASTTGETIAGVLSGNVSIEDAIQHTKQGDIVAGFGGLANADNILTGQGAQYILRDILKPLKKKYDYVIIDTPPALNILSINALVACDKLVITAQADLLSLQGIKALASTIEAVKSKANPSLELAGVLLTRYNPRSIYTAELTELFKQLAEQLGTKLFNSTIREGIAIKESQIRQESLFEYAPKAKVTADYKGFIKELTGGRYAKRKRGHRA